MPRGHAFSGRERLQKVVSLGSPECDRVQARRAVPPQHQGQDPRAEAAARVVEDGPAAFAGRAGRAPFLSVVCHVDTALLGRAGEPERPRERVVCNVAD